MINVRIVVKYFIITMLIGCSIVWAGDIKSDVEEILTSEFESNSNISLHKYEVPVDIKTEIEKYAKQKFFNNYFYLWSICQRDSIAGYAILDNTYGKSLPITFLVIFSPGGEIRRMDIIRYREPYGGAIASRRWLDQFIGKSSDDEFRVDKEVDSLSGATISVNSITRGVHKLVLVINQIISENNFGCIQKPHQAESGEN